MSKRQFFLSLIFLSVFNKLRFIDLLWRETERLRSWISFLPKSHTNNTLGMFQRLGLAGTSSEFIHIFSIQSRLSSSLKGIHYSNEEWPPANQWLAKDKKMMCSTSISRHIVWTIRINGCKVWPGSSTAPSRVCYFRLKLFNLQFDRSVHVDSYFFRQIKLLVLKQQ